ncbi:MAG: capsule biosynthesis protein, partial [Methylocystaceae bacterium]|nr:capsule biosynthesis protein [Methylocystaceae bacterium]
MEEKNKGLDTPLEEDRVQVDEREVVLSPMPQRSLPKILKPVRQRIMQTIEHVKEPVTEKFTTLIGEAPPLWTSFLVFVLAPAVAVALYFAFIASDQYTVEARFAVRALETDMVQTDTGGASGGGGIGPVSSSPFSFTATGQNAYIVTAYIKSRAAVDDTLKKLNLREIFRRPEADFWARLSQDASIDRLVTYWNTMVDTYIDAPSGIVTLRVRAFRRQDAVAIAQNLLVGSEELVNRISERARRDATINAEKEVKKAFGSVEQSLTDLRKFRDQYGVIDPGQTSTQIGSLLMPLIGEQIRIENELFVANREMAADSPIVRVLKDKLDSVTRQINDLKSKLTGGKGDGGTVSSYIAKFEELEMQRILNEKFYALAQADFERAQLRANRQSIYLTVFDPPSMPEESRYPRRIAFSIIFALSLLIVWSI